MSDDVRGGPIYGGPPEPFDAPAHQGGVIDPLRGLDFGQALRALKGGKRVARVGWNGKGAWLVLVAAAPPATFYENCAWSDPPRGEARAAYTVRAVASGAGGYVPGLPGRLLPWIGMKTADDCFVPWLCSQSDALSEDWEIVP